MKSQELRVLERLQKADGSWVHGDRVFFQEMRLRQYHRAIFNLQNKRYLYKYEGKIVGDEGDEHKFKSYRLVTEPKQETLI